MCFLPTFTTRRRKLQSWYLKCSSNSNQSVIEFSRVNNKRTIDRWRIIWLQNLVTVQFISPPEGGFEKGTPTNEGLLVRLPGIIIPRIGPRRPLESIYFRHEEAYLKIILNNTAELEWDETCERSIAFISWYPLVVTGSPAPGVVSMKKEGLWVTFRNDHYQSDDDRMMFNYGQLVSAETCAVTSLPLDTQSHVVFAKSCGPR